MAKIVQKLTVGDLYEIETVKSYPADYTETTNIALEEKRKNACPELTGKLGHIDSYVLIYLGYLNWWELFRWLYLLFMRCMIFQVNV